MKRADIKVDHTYRSRGVGRTTRKVLAIGPEYQPHVWLGDPDRKPPPDAPGVEYAQNGHVHRLYLFSFAAWAGSEVSDGN